MEALEVHRLGQRWERALAVFFEDLANAGATSFFHPHALSEEEAKKLAQYDGADLYYVLTSGERVLGYGMLRGWAAGYSIPALGIVLHPSVRGQGLGETFARFLHHAAAARGACRIRLKVYRENRGALALYRKLGYRFDGTTEDGQLVGFLDLRPWSTPNVNSEL